MGDIRTKKQLEIMLSRLEQFDSAKVSSEQYLTPSHIAAEVLWKAYYSGHIERKDIADLGCGTGILGIGCLLLGARKVFFVDNDKSAIEICKRNTARLQSELSGRYNFVESDAMSFEQSVDSVFMNPPFGTKIKHADRDFLTKAFEISKVTYSFHKTATCDYIIDFSGRKGFVLREKFDFDFLLKNTMEHHRKRKQYIKVSCLILEKRGNERGNDKGI